MPKTKKEQTLNEMLAKLRREKKLSYEDVAERGMLPPQLVEEIEKGRVSPSIGALKKITRALEIPLSEFFQRAGISEKEVGALESSRDVVHIPRTKRKRLSVKGSRTVIEYLTPTSADRKLELLWQEVEPRSSGGDWLTHEGEECCFVVSGKVRMHVEDQVFDLEEGDTLWFRTAQRHKWENPFEQGAVLLWTITPPYHGKI
jgi:transcriptional regulator with XRE-family HTH domain